MDIRPVCKYGAKCYRKGADHLKNFQHPKPKHPSATDLCEDPVPKKKQKITDFFKSERKSSEINSSSAQEKALISESTSSKTNSDASLQPAKISSSRDFLKEHLLVEMPNDFWSFWELCKSLCADMPEEALNTVGLQLVGPFDVLSGRCVELNGQGQPPSYHRHWRYYFDPPEFLTVLRGDDATQEHYGYYRDDPKEMPAFVAVNFAAQDCSITPRGENLFAAVLAHIAKLESKKKQLPQDVVRIKTATNSWAREHQFNVDLVSSKLTARRKKVVCKTFHGAGIVVPVINDVGYRPVPETPGDLKKLFKRIAESKTDAERLTHSEKLQELVTLVQFANDECDYGEGLELGLDLFSFGGEVFHKAVLTLLPLAYNLLNRPEYAQIIQEHLKERKNTADLDQMR